ncbi:hypothetical protein SAMN05518866_10178 [Sphingobium sp. YR768]|jgi:hypothetical protein|nr:hypothetical protein SAMN05518866_10178 [Sphingobium sp. YR768]
MPDKDYNAFSPSFVIRRISADHPFSFSVTIP